MYRRHWDFHWYAAQINIDACRDFFSFQFIGFFFCLCEQQQASSVTSIWFSRPTVWIYAQEGLLLYNDEGKGTDGCCGFIWSMKNLYSQREHAVAAGENHFGDFQKISLFEMRAPRWPCCIDLAKRSRWFIEKVFFF